MANDKKSGGNATIIGSGGQIDKPLNVMSAISEIQLVSVYEKNPAEPIPENYLTIANRMDFFMVAMKNSLLTGMIGIILIPFSLAILDKLIPVFGDARPDFFDNIYAIVLLFGPSVAYGSFISMIAKCYVGNITKGMIKQFMSGLYTGELTKAGLISIFFIYIYEKITPSLILKNVQWLSLHIRETQAAWLGIYHWLVLFRDAFPTAAVVVIVNTSLMIGFPTVRIMLKKNKDRRLLKEGEF